MMTPFDPQTTTLIRNWNQTLDTPVKIKRISTDHAEEGQFINFAEQASGIAAKLFIDTQKGEDTLPCFLLRENVTYSALPLERELAPFLDALSQLNTRNRILSDQLKQALDTLDIPVRLKLYIALQCPHCPTVVRTVIPLALYCKKIHLTIIDGTLFPDSAQKDHVLSTPCLILDNDLRWTGSVSDREIVTLITSRDPEQLSVDMLKTILEQGNAQWIAGQMIEKKKIFNSFLNLLLHETWSVRLGAMVVVEDIAQTDPDLAALMCPDLINLFDEKKVPVQGDILYALGEAGTNETRAWIKAKLPTLDHPDLIDAAQDALDSLEETDQK